jgi:hypothetical protein
MSRIQFTNQVNQGSVVARVLSEPAREVDGELSKEMVAS